jgi:transposase-like protein
MRKRHTAEERERLLAEIGGGRSVREAAEKVGVELSTAYRWRRDSGGTPRRRVPAFARVIASAAVTRSVGGVVIEVGGTSIRVEAGFDARLLRDVVAALGER